MALTVALPLSGLDPNHFSTLSAKLLNLVHERNLPTAGRESPSTASESSGISSCVTSNTSSVEITPNSSRPVTPNQKKNEEKINNMNTQDKNNSKKEEEKKRKKREEEENKEREKREQERKKKNEDIKIMYNGRDILNLSPNIRPPMTWSTPPNPRIEGSRNLQHHKNLKTIGLTQAPCKHSDCEFSTNKMLSR